MTAAHHLLKVEKGRPTPEELAAVTLVLLARMAAAHRAATAGDDIAVRQHGGSAPGRPERCQRCHAPHGWDRPGP